MSHGLLYGRIVYLTSVRYLSFFIIDVVCWLRFAPASYRDHTSNNDDNDSAANSSDDADRQAVAII
jgi:hypothetical protein